MSIFLRLSSYTVLGGLLLSSVVAAGCGDDKGSTGVPIGELSRAYGAATCERGVSCATAGGDGALFVLMAEATPDACADSFAKSAALNVSQWVAAGKVSYDAVKAAECIEALSTTCDGDGELPAACDAAVVGLVAVGGACDDDQVCAGDAYCKMDQSNYECPGVCASLKAIGEDCTDWNECSDAAGPAECDFQTSKCVTSTPVTKVTVAVGERCGWSATPGGTQEAVCAEGLVCATGDDDLCAAVVAKGADCGGAGVVCALGTYCAPGDAGSTCQAMTIVSTAGGACNESDMTKPAAFCNVFKRLQCGEDKKCATVSGAVGSQCDRDVLLCNAGLYCDSDSGMCAAVKADGADCQDGDECTSGYCGSDDTCGALVCE